MRPEAIPTKKRAKDKNSAFGAMAESARPAMTKIMPACKVLRKPKLLLARPKNSSVARQPNI